MLTKVFDKNKYWLLMYNYEHSIKNYEYKFEKLATKLDRILIEFHDNVNIVCNANIHLSRNHPEYLGVWKVLIYKKSLSINDYFSGFLLLLQSFLFYILSIMREFIRFNQNQPMSNQEGSKLDVMFISHQIQDLVTDDDFYFGEIIRDLAQSNKRVVRLLISHLNFSQSLIEPGGFTTLILNRTVSKLALINYFFANMYSLLRLFLFCLRNGFKLYEIICVLIGQLSNFSLIKIMNNIEIELKSWRPKNLIITFEGNAIERAVLLLSKKYNSKSFGYQHAPIIKNQHSILRLLKGDLDPDVILCSGPYSNSKFLTKLGKGKIILTLGSPKFRQFEDKENFTKGKDSILLVPDGNFESIDNFVNLGYYLLSSKYSGAVLIRSHPLFHKYLENKISKLSKNCPHTLLISSENLIESLQSSKCVVYQNSSVAIQAILEGCHIIYLRNPLMNIDPLWEHNEYRSIATSFGGVKTVVETLDPSKDFSPMALHEAGKLFFSELNLDIILNSLK